MRVLYFAKVREIIGLSEENIDLKRRSKLLDDLVYDRLMKK